MRQRYLYCLSMLHQKSPHTLRPSCVSFTLFTDAMCSCFILVKAAPCSCSIQRQSVHRDVKEPSRLLQKPSAGPTGSIKHKGITVQPDRCTQLRAWAFGLWAKGQARGRHFAAAPARSRPLPAGDGPAHAQERLQALSLSAQLRRCGTRGPSLRRRAPPTSAC